jgi:hypothetical protein
VPNSRRRRLALPAIGVLAAVAVAVVAVVVAAPADRSSSSDEKSAAAEQPSPQQRVSFPVRVSSNQRFLIDGRGEPFLLVADTAWSLLTALPADQATRYLNARKAQGFNTILTVLVFPSRGRGMTGVDSVFRAQPFINNDITRPNEAYFEVVDAARLGHADRA